MTLLRNSQVLAILLLMQNVIPIHFNKEITVKMQIVQKVTQNPTNLFHSRITRQLETRTHEKINFNSLGSFL